MTNHDHCSMSEMRKSAYVKNIKRHLISRHSLPDAEVRSLVKEARQSMPVCHGENASCTFCGRKMLGSNIAKHMLICKANTSVKAVASTYVTQGVGGGGM